MKKFNRKRVNEVFAKIAKIYLQVAGLGALLLLVFAFCSRKNEIESPHMTEAYKVIGRFSSEQKKKGLRSFGAGGAFNGGINSFNLTFLYENETMDIESSRKIIVNSLEELFTMVNNDHDVTPYLTNFPYDERHIYFVISFKKSGFTSLEKPNIALVCCADGDVIYDIYEEKDPAKYQKVHKESYAESYEKVYGTPLPANRFDIPVHQFREQSEPSLYRKKS